MTDTTVATATPAVKGAAKVKAAKPKRAKAANSHPKYVDMTVEAINTLKERNGSSRQAILKFITSNYSLGKDTKVVNTHLKLALKRGVATGVLKHAKGQGASGSFRVSSDKKGGSSVAVPTVKSASAKTSKAKKVKAVAEKAAKKLKTPEKKKNKKKAAVVAAVKLKKEKKVKTPKKSSPEKKKSSKGAKKLKSPSKKTSSDKKKKGTKGSKRSPKKSAKK